MGAKRDRNKARKQFRASSRADIWREVMAAEPEYVKTIGPDEIWARGRTLMVVPAIRESYPAELKSALSVRRHADLYLRCPGCGAGVSGAGVSGEVPPPSGLAVVRMRHGAGCIATDSAIRGIVARYGLGEAS